MAAIVVLSALGLFCRRIDDYDDPALLMGARMLRAGLLPYTDFYTHYGPFGYTLQSVFSRGFNNPPLALRLGQATLFCLLAFVASWLARSRGGSSGAWVAAALSILVFSVSTLYASFYGLGLAALALGAFAASDSGGRWAGRAWAAGGGLALAAALLTRPVFGLYAGVAIAIVSFSNAEPASHDRRLAFWLATGGSFGLLWTLLYHRIPLGEAFQATIVFPSRLMSGGSRYREGAFVRAPLPLAMAFAALAAAAQLAWAAAIPRWRVRVLSAGGVLLAALIPVVSRASRQPVRAVTLLSLGVLLIAVLIVVLQRTELRDGLLRGAALFGVTSAAFGHYFWSRQDRPHWIPAFTVGVVAAAFACGRLRRRGRFLVAGLFLANVLVFAPPPVFPAEELWNGGWAKVARNIRARHGSWDSIWPCREVPGDAAAAVRAADGHAEPGSRFVAVASTQASTAQNPILLFLLSTRLPYTRYYAYDPGVQSSPAIQQEMIRELEHSASATAVVWPAQELQEISPPVEGLAITRLDEAFQRIFPLSAAHYGRYEVRIQERTLQLGPTVGR